jgi:hypothetical protein
MERKSIVEMIGEGISDLLIGEGYIHKLGRVIVVSQVAFTVVFIGILPKITSLEVDPRVIGILALFPMILMLVFFLAMAVIEMIER